MPPLKDPFKEKIALDLVRNNGNKVKTYHEHKPHVTRRSALSNATAFMDHHGITRRAREIAERSNKLCLDNVVSSLEEGMVATKKVCDPYHERLIDVPDHTIRNDTKKFLLEKVHGLRQEKIQGKDEKHLHFHLSENQISRLDKIAGELNLINKQMFADSTEGEQEGYDIPE